MSKKIREEEWKPSDDINAPIRQPLFRELTAATPFPLPSLGPLLGSAAQSIKDAIQAPDALCGQSILGAAALAVQAHGNIDMDGRVKPISLFMLTIAQSGERKSAVDSEVLKEHRAYEKRQIEKYDLEHKEFLREVEVWDAAKKSIFQKRKNGEVSKEEISMKMRELGDKPEPPISQIMLMNEPTLEGMQKALSNGRPSIGLFSDEGGQVVGGHSMSAENQLKTAAGISSLWDGSAISRVRAGDGSSKIYGKRLSMHLMLQPRVAEQLTGNSLLVDQGLLARCLMVFPDSTSGSRMYKEVDLNDDKAMAQYRNVMRDALNYQLPLKERNELHPRSLQFEPSAKRLWIEFHNHVESQMKSNGKLSPIRGFASKAAEQVHRIAGVLALVEDIQTSVIGKDFLEYGLDLTQHYLEEALRLHNTSILNPDLIQAQVLSNWCSQFNEVYATQIYQLGPYAIRDKATAHKMIKILEEHGHLRRIEGGKGIDGKHRKDVWEVVK